MKDLKIFTNNIEDSAKAKRDYEKDHFFAEREYKIIELTTKD